MMKALVYHDWGTDAKVEDVPIPDLSALQKLEQSIWDEHYLHSTNANQEQHPPPPPPRLLLVKVMYASLNPVDYKVMKGDMKGQVNISLPRLVGFDFSGAVEAIGVMSDDESTNNSNPCRFTVGEKVFGFVHGLRSGTVAQYVVVHESVCSKVPTHISSASLSATAAAPIPQDDPMLMAMASASGLAGTTALRALDRLLGLSAAGDTGTQHHQQHHLRLLITGGSGGVGTAAIQLAKSDLYNHFISWVATTCSESNRGFCESLGADEVFNYRANEGRWADQFAPPDILTCNALPSASNAASRKKYDLILDTADDTEQAVKLLSDEPRKIVHSEGPSSDLTTDNTASSPTVVYAPCAVSIVKAATASSLLRWANESMSYHLLKLAPRLIINYFPWLIDWGSGARNLTKLCRRYGKSDTKYYDYVLATGGYKYTDRLATAMELGQFRPVVSRVYEGIDKAPEALADIISGHMKGKLVIKI